ncbi:hypothetical protein NMY22_g4059 [Coprinellus aureogranulatus]|nr:hypothetical protein NMY22_g4059 [Coprinellus aureogranulatus]
MSPSTPTNPALDRSSITPDERLAPRRRNGGVRMKPESRAVKNRRIAEIEKYLEKLKSECSDRALTSGTPDDPEDLERPSPKPTRPSKKDPDPHHSTLDLSSDDAGAGPLDKDDSLYRDRSVRSRIAFNDATHNDDVSISASVAVAGVVEGVDCQPPRHPRTPPGLTQKPLKRPIKSAEFVDSSDDETKNPQQPVREENPPSKRLRKDSSASTTAPSDVRSVQRRASRPEKRLRIETPSPSPSPTRPPPAGSLAPDDAGRSNLAALLGYLDDEAVESGEGEGSDDQIRDAEMHDPNEDDYDRADSFINDSDDESGDSDSSMEVSQAPRRQRTPSLPPRSMPKIPQDLPGDESEATVSDRTLLRLLRATRPKRNRLPDDRSSIPSGRRNTSLASTRAQTPDTVVPSSMLPTPQTPVTRPRPRPTPRKMKRENIEREQFELGHGVTQRGPIIVSSDDEDTPSHAKQEKSMVISTSLSTPTVKRESTINASTPPPPSHSLASPYQPPPSAKASGRSSLTTRTTDVKGKGKARAPTPPFPESDNEGSIHLSDMSDYERAQWEQAIFLSKHSQMPNTPGESSTQGSKSSVRRDRDALSTPQATALFTEPSPASAPSREPVPTISLTPQQILRRSNAIASGQTSTAATLTPPVSPSAPAPVTLTADQRALAASLIRRCSAADLPSKCEVTHPSLWDPLLADQYPGLTPLRDGYIQSWSRKTGDGFVNASAWTEQCPGIVMPVALGAINAKDVGHIRNGCRTSPVNIALYTPPDTEDRYHFYCADGVPGPLVAFMSGMLEESQLMTPSTSGLCQKSLSVIPHTQEWHRYKGLLRTASGYDTLHAQYSKNALQFTTRPLNRSPNNGNAKNPDAGNKTKGKGKGLRANKSKMFNTARADDTDSNRLSVDNFSLDANATIPIYDARGLPSFDFEANLPRLSEALPPWTGGEIPYGSFVVVGHTIAIYRSKAGNWTLSCNLQWVIVVGTPSDDNEEGDDDN